VRDRDKEDLFLFLAATIAIETSPIHPAIDIDDPHR
jgi:hypothetical protein